MVIPMELQTLAPDVSDTEEILKQHNVTNITLMYRVNLKEFVTLRVQRPA